MGSNKTKQSSNQGKMPPASNDKACRNRNYMHVVKLQVLINILYIYLQN